MTLDPAVLDFQSRYSLMCLNAETFQVRAAQKPIMERVLTTTDDALIVGPTSAGKTLVFIVEAAKVIAQGGRVVFVTVTQHLAQKQFGPLYFAKFLTIPPEKVIDVSGLIRPDRRVQLYQRRPVVLIGTPETLANDIESGEFVWDDIRLIGCDEIHHYSGRDAYTRLMPLTWRPGIRHLYLSATPADNARELIERRDDLRIRHIFVMPGRDVLPEEPVIVDVDEALARGAQTVKEVALSCQRFIMSRLPRKQLELDFGDLEDIDWDCLNRQELPSHQEREFLFRRIGRVVNDGSKDDNLRRFLWSKWSEMSLVCWLHDALITCGWYGFWESFACRYARHGMIPVGVCLLDIEGKIAKGQRMFEKRVVMNDRLWALFAQSVKGTAYEALVGEKSWHKILGLNKCPVPGRGLRERAQRFFDDARDEVARREAFDHPKIAALLDIFRTHPQVGNNGQAIVFTHMRRYTDFLATVVNHRLGAVGFRAVAAAGARSSRQRRQNDLALSAFRSGEANVLFSTDYLREGMDVPKAQMCVEYCLPDTNPRKRVQGRGRVGRREDGSQAYLYHLLTRQSEEVTRHVVAMCRRKSAAKALTGRAEYLLADIRKEE